MSIFDKLARLDNMELFGVKKRSDSDQDFLKDPLGMMQDPGRGPGFVDPTDPTKTVTPAKSDTLLTSLPMPSLTDSDRRSAARKSMARLRARGGRATTILTDPLGGGL